MGLNNSTNTSIKNDIINEEIKDSAVVRKQNKVTFWEPENLNSLKKRKNSESSTKSSNTMKSSSSSSSTECCKLAIIHHSQIMNFKKEHHVQEKSVLINKATMNCELQIKSLFDSRLVNITYGVNCSKLKNLIIDNNQKSLVDSKPKIDKFHNCYLCYKDNNLVYNKVKEDNIGSYYSEGLSLILKKLFSTRIEKNEKNLAYSYSSIDLTKRNAFKSEFEVIDKSELFFSYSKSEYDDVSYDSNFSDNQSYFEFNSNSGSSFNTKNDSSSTRNVSTLKSNIVKDDIRNKYFTSLFSKNIWHKKSSHNNIIILDWDDTLLCTSFLTPLGYFQENMYFAPEDISKIKTLEKYVFSLLEKCINQSDTFIVTNASTQWIEYSSNKFYPSITSLLQNINIISARETCEKVFPGNQRKWKLETFKLIVDKFKRDIITNIVCIGDSFIEMEAGHVIASQFNKAYIKSVKFKEAPKLEELVKQLKLLTSQFDFIFSSPKSLTVTVERKKKEKERENKLS